VTGGYDNSLKLWDATSGAMVREFKAYKVKEFEKGHQDSVFAAAFSPDGKYLASGSGGLERVIKIWDVAKGAVIRDLVNPQIQAANPKAPPQSHPGWVYKLRFTRDGKHLVSAGDAPMNKGYLAVWNPQDGKLLYGEALPLGNFFGLSVSADSKMVALGAGPRGRPTPEFNCAYLLKWPVMEK
jgi:WD40 repeat protein